MAIIQQTLLQAKKKMPKHLFYKRQFDHVKNRYKITLLKLLSKNLKHWLF